MNPGIYKLCVVFLFIFSADLRATLTSVLISKNDSLSMENEITEDIDLDINLSAETQSPRKILETCKDGPPNIARLEPSKNGSVAIARKQDDCNDICISSSCVEIAATLLQSMDLRKDPCEDFYSYVCGRWDKNNPIPDDRGSYDTFTKMRDHLDIIVRGLLEKPIFNGDNRATVKAKKLYQSCVNEEIIERRGSEPLLRFIDELGGWPVIDLQWNASNFRLEEMCGTLRNMHNDVLISLWEMCSVQFGVWSSDSLRGLESMKDLLVMNF